MQLRVMRHAVKGIPSMMIYDDRTYSSKSEPLCCAVPYFKRASLFLIMKTYWGDKLSICLEGPLIFPGRSTPVQLPHEQSLTLNLSDREQSDRSHKQARYLQTHTCIQTSRYLSKESHKVISMPGEP